LREETPAFRLGRRPSAAAFALLAAFVLAGIAGAWRLPWLSRSDLALSLWLQRSRTPTADTAMRLLSDVGTDAVGIPLMVLTSLWLYRQGRPREAVAAFACLVATPLNVVLKLIANRPRPGGAVAVLAGTYGTSFPSGHAMGSAAVYGTLAALVWSRTGRAAPTAALLLVPIGVGVSRVYLGAHYGYDVLAGWAAGALVVAGVVAWLRKGGEASDL